MAVEGVATVDWRALAGVRVGDVMTKQPETVSARTPISEAVARLLERDYTALPVVDVGWHVIGVLDESELLARGLVQMSLSLHKVIDRDLLEEYLAVLRGMGGEVGEVMVATPTVKVDLPLEQAARVMHDGGLKRLPVVDGEGRLQGMLGRVDILRRIVHGPPRPERPDPAALPAQHRKCGDLAERDVPTVGETAKLPDVVKKLLEHSVKRVVVVDDDGAPVGIVTDSDLVARVDPADRPGLLTLLRSAWGNTDALEQVVRARGQIAADVMTKPVVTVDGDAPVLDALALTVSQRIKRLPVVDADGKLVGMVSRPALLAAALDLLGSDEDQAA